MFNNDLKDEAIEKLEAMINHVNRNREKLINRSEELFALRTEKTAQVIDDVGEYLQLVDEVPGSCLASMFKIKEQYGSFKGVVADLQLRIEEANLNAAGSAAGGVAMGVGTAALAPAAAMAIATTFGTASTGTAIASLSGAAATNAALAWIGGGTVVAGGGGMAGGGALLALAGPVGGAIALLGLAGGAWLKSSSNAEIAEQADKQRAKMNKENSKLCREIKKIEQLIRDAKSYAATVSSTLRCLPVGQDANFHDFSVEEASNLQKMMDCLAKLADAVHDNVTSTTHTAQPVSHQPKTPAEKMKECLEAQDA